MVHADSVSKSIRQNSFFFARAAIVSEGKNIIFRDNKQYKQRLGPPVPKRRRLCDLFSSARVLKRGRKREKQRKVRLGISAVTIRFTEQSLLILLSCLFFASDLIPLMHNSTGYVIKQLFHAFNCSLSSYGALGKFGEHLRS